jgi:hypothetical protein
MPGSLAAVASSSSAKEALTHAETFTAEVYAPQTRTGPVGLSAPTRGLVEANGTYECPPRLTGVALQDAASRFAPGPPPGPLDVKTRAKELQLEVKLGLKYLERTIKALRTGETKMQRKIKTHQQKGSIGEMQVAASSIVQSRRSVAVLETYREIVQRAYQDLAGCNTAVKFSSPVDVCMDAMGKMDMIMLTHEVQITLAQMQREMSSRIEEPGGGGTEPFMQGGQVAPSEIQRVLEELGCVI